MEVAKIEDKDVVVKVSSCNECDGVVRTAVKHRMTTKSKNDFMREVMEHNLSIKEQFLLDYRSENAKWCKCKN